MPSRTVQRSARKRPRSAKRPGTLRLYHAKRNLAASGEPGEVASERPKVGAIRRYVIQKHDATRLHYDFRLEMEGVYRSWAVPKGLPTEAGERTLAVEVEDHPLAYGNFEGTIPEGNYGAGTVMLWDRGNYTVSGVEPEVAYRQGKIHLALAGEKCVGEWTLVRMRPRPNDKHNNWLMIKNSGPQHRAPMMGAARERSVLSGRTMEEIDAGKERGTRRNGAAGKRSTRPTVKKKPPTRRRGGSRGKAAGEGGGDPAKFIPPMKAVSVDTVPAGTWRLEIKLDGYRAIAVINGGEIELWSRNHKPLTDDYPEVVEALKTVRCANAVIDGEIVALDEQGHSRFQLLQQRGKGTRPPIVYYVFDLLHHDGRSLLRTPIEERQMALEVLVGKKSRTLRFSPVFETEPAALLDAVRQQGLEGIIAKRPGSLYEPDRRSGTWLKCKVHGEQEFVIGGFTPPKKSRPYFGAILVGYYRGKELVYCGKVGTGFDHAALASLHAEFMKREVKASAFAKPPREKGVIWIKPELVAQVRFAEWTHDGVLRQPVFLGLRKDKAAKDVVREAGPVGAEG
jgi:bifunctional non-homologous end joining protein LigD